MWGPAEQHSIFMFLYLEISRFDIYVVPHQDDNSHKLGEFFVKYPEFINKDDQWADQVEGSRLSWFLTLIIIRRCRGYERGTYISWPSGVLHTLRIGGLHFLMNLLEANESLLILMSIIILILIIIILIILIRSEQIIRYSNIIRLLEAEY